MPWWFAGALGVLIGWVWAHNVIAAECEKLGKFYVGSRTFRCVEVVEQVTPEPPSSAPTDEEKPGQ